jgi:hypothetical protein
MVYYKKKELIYKINEITKCDPKSITNRECPFLLLSKSSHVVKVCNLSFDKIIVTEAGNNVYEIPYEDLEYNDLIKVFEILTEE